MNRPPRNYPPRIKEEPYRINLLIKAPEVRIVQMEDESQNGIYKLSDALGLAISMEKDLVEISPNANPPVCKIIEYSKFKYELKKREKEQKSNQKATEIKEVRFGPQTDDHDFNFKLRHAEKFLQDGHKVRAYVMFKGRAIVYKNQGEELLRRFMTALEEVGKVEQMPKMEGKKMIIILTPRTTGGKKEKEKPQTH